MKKSLAIFAAVGVASAASAQSVDIEPLDSTVGLGEAVTLTVFADSGPDDYAVAGFNFNVNASGGDWGGLTSLLTHPGQNPGTVVGSNVEDVSSGQLFAFGFVPEPGRIAVWSGDFSSATEGVFDISTETTRFEVYTENMEGSPRRSLTPTEGSASVTVIPAPASLALLGLGGLLFARRRRA